MPTTSQQREYNKFRPGQNDQTKVATTIEQDSSNPIPTIEQQGQPFFESGEEITSPASEVLVLSFNYSGSLQRRMTKFGVSSSVEGVASLYIDGNKVYSIRTNAAISNPEFCFDPYKIISGLIELKFRARENSPITAVNAFICGNDLTI